MVAGLVLGRTRHGKGRQPHRRRTRQQLQRRPVLHARWPKARLHAADWRHLQAVRHGPRRPKQTRCLQQRHWLQLRLQRIARWQAHQLPRELSNLHRQRRRLRKTAHRNGPAVQFRSLLVARWRVDHVRQRRTPQLPSAHCSPRWHGAAQTRRSWRLPRLDRVPRRLRLPHRQQRFAGLVAGWQVCLLHGPG